MMGISRRASKANTHGESMSYTELLAHVNSKDDSDIEFILTNGINRARLSDLEISGLIRKTDVNSTADRVESEPIKTKNDVTEYRPRYEVTNAGKKYIRTSTMRF